MASRHTRLEGDKEALMSPLLALYLTCCNYFLIFFRFISEVPCLIPERAACDARYAGVKFLAFMQLYLVND